MCISVKCQLTQGEQSRTFSAGGWNSPLSFRDVGLCLGGWHMEILFAYPLGEFTGKQPLCFCFFAIHASCLFTFLPNFIFFSLCQAWLIVDFHQITTIIHRPVPPSRQPVKASPADRKEKSRFTHFRKSCLSPWHGHGCQIPVSLWAVSCPLILLKESIWSVAWRPLWRGCGFGENRAKHGSFFFFPTW